jgi:3-dehydroquinate dehydratase type I
MICIPVVAKTHAGALRAVGSVSPAADVIELRMDLILDGRLAELIDRVRACHEAVKVLVTHRLRAETDPSRERQRIGVLKDAVGLGADYVDVELETDPVLTEELRAAIRCRGNRTRLIISHHDFHRTPSYRALKSLSHRCAEAGADIVKIVTWAGCMEDNLRVLHLISDAGREGRAIIAFCMGPSGRISRIAAPLLGSCLSYVSLRKGRESASGQLTLREMNRIMDILRRDR